MRSPNNRSLLSVNEDFEGKRNDKGALLDSFFSIVNDMHTIASITNALFSPTAEWRTLRGVVVEAEAAEGARFLVGNSSVVVAARIEGESVMIKCYTRHKPRLSQIYGKLYHPEELVVYNIMGERHYVDCVVYPRIAGTPLDRVLADKQCDIRRIANAFEQLSRILLDKTYAHGDIKPENIILAEDGQMHLVDWDAAFVPELSGEEAIEIGTAAYQHPLRTAKHFNAHIDDYSIAYLLTMLRWAEIDRSILDSYRLNYSFSPSPREIFSLNRTFVDHVATRFASLGKAREVAIARLLLSPTVALPTLRLLLQEPIARTDTPIEVEQEAGKWGLRCDEGWVVPPLYDSILEPRHDITIVGIEGFYSTIRLFSSDIYPLGRASRLKLYSDGSVSFVDEQGEQQFVTIDDILQ